jgi:hypothetical protein
MLITASTSVQQLIPQNMLRKSLVFQNVDGSIIIYIKRERPGVNNVSATDFDLRLNPGAAFSLNTLLDGEEAIQDRWTVIAASGTPQVAVFETEDKKR